MSERIKTLATQIHPSLGIFYDKHESYCNFALVGALGVVWQYLLTGGLIAIGFPWWFAMFIGILIAWNSNYFLNKHWVFKIEKGKKCQSS